MSRAVIDNQSEFPTGTVKSSVRWVLRELDVDLSSLVVRVTPYNCERTVGRFYRGCKERRPRVWSRHSPGLQISEEAEHLIVTRIPTIVINGRKRRGGPPPFTTNGWLENLICITAHEAQHLRQHLFRQNGRPRWSEVESEWAEYRLLKRWKQSQI
jgi:hypothetical protein